MKMRYDLSVDKMASGTVTRKAKKASEGEMTDELYDRPETLTAEEVIRRAHIAAGYKPGESLIARYTELRENYERPQHYITFAACRQAGARFAESREVKEPTPEEKERLKELASSACGPFVVAPMTSVQYHQALEDIQAGEWVTLADDGGVRRCPNQAELREAYGPLMRRKKREEFVPEPAMKSWAIPGCLTLPKKVAGRVSYEVILQHSGEGGEVSPESFVGKPVMNVDRTETIGRIVGAERKGNFIVGEIQFDGEWRTEAMRRMMPRALAELRCESDEVVMLVNEALPAGAIVKSFDCSGVQCQVTHQFDGNPPSTPGLFEAKSIEPWIEPTFPDEPKQETWRDRPSML